MGSDPGYNSYSKHSHGSQDLIFHHVSEGDPISISSEVLSELVVRAFQQLG